jgi:hypothetical protein
MGSQPCSKGASHGWSLPMVFGGAALGITMSRRDNGFFSNGFCNFAGNVIYIHFQVTILVRRDFYRREMPKAREISRAVLV